MRRTFLPLLLALLACEGDDDRAHAPDADPPGRDTDPGDPFGVLAACAPDDALPRPMRRWTRWQYDRAVSDLLGVPLTLTEGFPAENGGWESVPAGQAITPAHVEAWSAAAEAAAATLTFGYRTTIEGESLDVEGATTAEIAANPGVVVLLFGADPDVPAVVPLPVEVRTGGTYRITVRIGWRSGFDLPVLTEWHAPRANLRVGDVVTEEQAVTVMGEELLDLVWDVEVPAGAPLVLEVAARAVYQGFALDRVVLEGPWEAPLAGASPALGPLACDPLGPKRLTCVEEALRTLAPRAWRRPVTNDEIGDLLAVARAVLDEDGDLDEALHLAVEAMLLAPSFLFHADAVDGLPPGGRRAATPHEIAARLALLLWGSLPDEALRACAEAGGLAPDDAGPCGLSAQVERMLAHPRADAVVRDFGRQWLGLDEIATLGKDPIRYPGFDAALAASLAEGVEARLADVAVRDADLRDLIDGTTAFADATLAPLYGRTAPGDDPVPLDGLVHRPGLMGDAGILALTADPDRTSPVQRGAFVLAKLLCDPPDPPPADIPALPANAASGDLRAMLEAHRSQPACAGCHVEMDGLGLVYEGQDAIGRDRTRYEDGTPVDTTGWLPDRTPVEGPAALAAALAEDPAVAACIVHSLATWGLGETTRPACEQQRLDVLPAGHLSFGRVLRTLATSTAITTVAAAEETP